MAKKTTTKKTPALLTPEEMAALTPFECNMRTALNSDYARSIGPHGAEVLNGVLQARGLATIPDAGTCVSCSLRLLTTVGRMYFATKDANVVPDKQGERNTLFNPDVVNS